MSCTYFMRWPCVLLLLLLWHDLENFCMYVRSLPSLLRSLLTLTHSHSLSLEIASHVVILQLDKPFIFLKKHMYLYIHTHTRIYVCFLE